MKTRISLRLPSIHPTQTGIFLLWLVHLTAIIGISLDFEDWFISKTPASLLLLFVLTVWLLPVNTLKLVLTTFFFFIAGMLTEWMGVQFGWLFGEYNYGSNLGPKLDGVPLLIGMNWAILVFCTGTIVSRVTSSPLPAALTGAVLMVLLDLLMEVCAPRFDFWEFAGGVAPISNYVAWFGLAFLLNLVFQVLKIKGNATFALHVFLSQLVFFGFFCCDTLLR